MNIKIFLTMTLLAGLSLMVGGCGGSDGPDPDPVAPKGKHLEQTCNIGARAAETIVTLTGLTAKVSRNTGTAAWLTVEVMPYTAGTPQVKVTATENSLADSRRQELTFYAANDTLVLTVCQEPFNAGGGTDVDNPFDTPSEQPGFARRP